MKKERVDPRSLALAQQLVERLEKLSPDSRWARRSSGFRGNLIKLLEQIEGNGALHDQPVHDQPVHDQPVTESELSELQKMVNFGYWILEQAARELIE